MYLMIYLEIFALAFVFGLVIVIYSFIKGRYDLIKHTLIVLSVLSIILGSHFYYFFVRDILSNQVVDISPMMKINITQDVDTIKNYFPDYKVELSDGILPAVNKKDLSGRKEVLIKKYENGGFVRITLFYTLEDASRYFSLYSKDNPVYRVDTRGRDDNGSYCISYVKANRTDPEGGSVPTGQFISRVSLQKQNLLITVAEDRGANNRGDGKDEIIKEIATKLAEFEPHNTTVSQ